MLIKLLVQFVLCLYNVREASKCVVICIIGCVIFFCVDTKLIHSNSFLFWFIGVLQAESKEKDNL